jgi:hypothetical protein
MEINETNEVVATQAKLGIGKRATEMLALGMSKQLVLDTIKREFPTGKTTMNCISYYKYHLENPGAKKGGAKAPKAQAFDPFFVELGLAHAPKAATATLAGKTEEEIFAMDLKVCEQEDRIAELEASLALALSSGVEVIPEDGILEDLDPEFSEGIADA